MKKITKYKDQIEELWQEKLKTVLIIERGLGVIPKYLEHHLNIIGINKITIHLLQKAVLFETAYILQGYLQHCQTTSVNYGSWGGLDG